MRVSKQWVVAACATTVALASTAPAPGHQTVSSRGVAVTLHVQPNDEPRAGKRATIVVVRVSPPSGRFSFRTCACRVKVATASGTVLLNRRTAKRTTFTFPDAGAYKITYSGRYRTKSGKVRGFSAGFAIRAH
jgi:hypothetical protein